ncbi:uncharacterized protein L969DRAFT_49961 [Mixia osmundae IAM 14324]|uniref:Secreted protein n=1 Tax=Mixia osmundae (strain CBS 9802 / IAM 14324 / JCM 22182 / KY 12970) TaxID=764103 RepID=G7E6T1_MIXOS|nr:uncharacterized protein L969DRAFT_49961 [Mixia osmundae IAM 14324]KEI39076.1 hypothetical protein L969DRAFT_49961 [Mixia osmundae IAM 14324]GAA98541.1 hypothetical protein E5Q_05228 [Mixia osmundae IAM 14324]
MLRMLATLIALSVGVTAQVLDNKSSGFCLAVPACSVTCTGSFDRIGVPYASPYKTTSVIDNSMFRIRLNRVTARGVPYASCTKEPDQPWTPACLGEPEPDGSDLWKVRLQEDFGQVMKAESDNGIVEEMLRNCCTLVWSVKTEFYFNARTFGHTPPLFSLICRGSSEKISLWKCSDMFPVSDPDPICRAVEGTCAPMLGTRKKQCKWPVSVSPQIQ